MKVGESIKSEVSSRSLRKGEGKDVDGMGAGGGSSV